MDAYLEALKAYQVFNPAGWVSLYRVLPMWTGLVSVLVGLALLLLGGDSRLFRFLAGPLGGALGMAWTAVVLGKLGVSGLDSRVPGVVATVLFLLGLLYPPAIVLLAVGIPAALLGGEIAGARDYLVGFAPGFILGALGAALLHRQLAAVIASGLGAWLLVIGAMAALHRFTGLVGAMARQPWGIVIAAGLFAIAGAIYQLAVRPSPEDAERQKAERQRLKARKAEQQALEKRWGASSRDGR